MVAHCIDDDFKIFLDKQFYPDKNPNAWQQSHTYYHPFSDDKTFNHHNPMIEKDYQYFKRGISRFRKLLKSDAFCVFLHIVVNSEPINQTFKDKIIKFNNFFKTKANNYALICIVQSVGKKQEYHFDAVDNIHFIDLTTISNSNGKEFIMNDDNIFLDKLLNDVYTFDIQPLK
jgi:hypothetical protein